MQYKISIKKGKKVRVLVPVIHNLLFVHACPSEVKRIKSEGTVDGEWYKALIVSDKIPANVAVIDVRSATEFANGHIKGAINIEAGKMSATEFAAKLPKGKVSIINCATGGRAMEAFMKLQSAKIDVAKILYFDANIKCDKSSKCEIKVNEPLG
jgi:rhodanese-related sulfurtransferase